MSGIAGGVGSAVAAVPEVLGGIAHRARNGTALHQGDGFSLGQARPRPDASGAHRGPVVDESTQDALVLSGAIYNRDALRNQLGRRAFGNEGDAALLLAGLQAEGPPFLDRANGIYALAWWEAAARRLHLARDPAGVRSLHFHGSEGGLVFASEAKALLGQVGPVRLDPLGVAAFLRYHFVPAESTVTAGIRRLRQGTVLTIDEQGREVARYATKPWRSNPSSDGSPAQVWSWLQQTMARQLEPGKPAGVFLSGGIDSSVLAALAVQESDAPVHTWTVGFDVTEQNGRDERAPASELARRLGTRHCEIRIDGDRVAKDIGRIAWLADGPLGEVGIIPTSYAAHAAASDVDVVFIGEGSDSLFAGGGQYKAQMRFERWSRRLPRSELLATWAGRVLPGKGAGAARAMLRRTPSERYSSLIEIFLPEHLTGAGLPRPALPPMQSGWTFMDLDRNALLPDNYYVKIDMGCGAVGLEGRVPYTDRELAALCDFLPVAEKVGPPEKKILREAAAPALGGSAARKKQGYSTPFLEWANGPLAHDVGQALQDPCAVRLDLMSAAAWRSLCRRIGAEGLHPQRRRWMLYALDLWLREIERRGLT